MTTKTDQCRAAFEEWTLTEGGSISKDEYPELGYDCEDTEINWYAWQAAWKARGE